MKSGKSIFFIFESILKLILALIFMKNKFLYVFLEKIIFNGINI